jgi:hypothetical protein
MHFGGMVDGSYVRTPVSSKRRDGGLDDLEDLTYLGLCAFQET